MICNDDHYYLCAVDLFLMYSVVNKLGGYEAVSLKYYIACIKSNFFICLVNGNAFKILVNQCDFNSV